MKIMCFYLVSFALNTDIYRFIYKNVCKLITFDVVLDCGSHENNGGRK